VERTYLPDGTVYELTAYWMPDPTCRAITDMNALQTDVSQETPVDTVDSDSKSSDSNVEFESESHSEVNIIEEDKSVEKVECVDEEIQTERISADDKMVQCDTSIIRIMPMDNNYC